MEVINPRGLTKPAVSNQPSFKVPPPSSNPAPTPIASSVGLPKNLTSGSKSGKAGPRLEIENPAEPRVLAAASPSTLNDAFPPDQYSGRALLDALWRSPERIHQIGTLDRKTGKFKNIHVNDVSAAVNRALALSNAGTEVYFACAEYLTPNSRIADNVSGARGFWLDLDCGEDKAAAGKGYLTAEDASQALKKFCKDAELPEPTHTVDSGGGLHIHFVNQRPNLTTPQRPILTRVKASISR